MPLPSVSIPAWLNDWMQAHDVALWGGADLREFKTPGSEKGQGFPAAVSLAIPMPPPTMGSIRRGPTQAYAAEYARVNSLIDALSGELARELRRRGHRAMLLPASSRTDAANIKGDFPHKTAATRAGLGWIGKHCQLITRRHGPWVRLGTVFSDIEIPCGPPRERSHCGKCSRCVDACPARALKGRSWYPGLPREEILDVRACDDWKKEHYFEYHSGHVCGICSAVCPYGLKTLVGGFNLDR